MKLPLRVAIFPMTSTDSVGVNVQNVLEFLHQLESPVDIVFLPENSLYFNFNKKLDPNDAIAGPDELTPIMEWCQHQKTAVHFGGVPFKTLAGIANTSLFIDEQGHFKNIYSKIHLFDVDIDGRKVRESESFVAGKEPAILDFKGWRLGLSICYDLRFSELFVHYHKMNVDAIVVPSSFLVETGRAHWNTLLRARAIETQSYVLAPAQVGIHTSHSNPLLPHKTTWGESLAISPWGDVLARSPSFDEYAGSHEPLILDLRIEPLSKVRLQMPTLSHRKL